MPNPVLVPLADIPTFRGEALTDYVLSEAPFTRHYWNGSALVPISSNVGYLFGTGNAARNRAALQDRISDGGVISITDPGTLWIDQVLSIPSNTAIYVGAGVEIKPINGAECGVFTNANARTAGTVISAWNGLGGASSLGATWVNVTINGSLLPGMRIENNAIAAAFPVGSVIAIAGTSVGEWIGVWEVAVAGNNGTTNYIEFPVEKPPSNGANPSAAVNLTMRIFPADENIVVWGPGAINGNGSGMAGTYNTGHPLGNVIWTHNARHITYDGLYFKRGTTWTIGSSNVANYNCRNLRGNVNTPGLVTCDFIHLAGAHRNPTIENIDADSQDNTVGMTIDIPFGTAYDYPYYDAGDIINPILRNIKGRTPAAVIGIYGPPSFKYRNLQIDGVYGRGSAAVQFATYSFTNMTQFTADHVTIRNVGGVSNGEAVVFIGNMAVETLSIDGVDAPLLGGPVNVRFQQSAGDTATFKEVTVSGIKHGLPGVAKPGNVMSIEGATQGTTNIGVLTINNSNDCQIGSGYAYLRRSNLGTLGKVVYNGVSVESLASGAGALHADIAGCGPTTEIVFNDSRYTGVAQTGNMYDQGSNVTTTVVRFNRATISGAAGFINAQNTTPTINVFMDGVSLGAVQCARAGAFAGPTNLTVNGYQELVAPVNNPFQTVTAAKAYNFRFENIGRDADSIQKTAGNLRFHGGGARTAIANVNTPSAGDLVFDLTGGVRVARNIANAAWVNLHT